MSLRLRSCFILVVVITYGAAERDEGVAAAREDVQRLILQLGDPSYRLREEASEKLEAMGEPVLPTLRNAEAFNASLEIRFRAHTVVGRIMWTACHSRTTGMRFALLEAGEFTMGSPHTETDRLEGEQQHKVRIRRPFLIGVYEVTQAEYSAVMEHAPSWFAAAGKGKEKVGDEDTRRFPVDSVSWFDAIAFCNRLSERDGLPLYYKLTDVQDENGSMRKATVKVAGGIGYRLPTEAECEYACRAGSKTSYHFARWVWRRRQIARGRGSQCNPRDGRRRAAS